MNHNTSRQPLSPLLFAYGNQCQTIPYRKEFNAVTGKHSSSILLQQFLFRGGQQNPFYKFQAPCNHQKYRKGDSWQEELGFSRKEFETALSRIATKITTGMSKSEVMSRQTPESMIVYWTDASRVTWWELNLPLIEKLLSKCLIREAELMSESDISSNVRKSHYQLMPESDITYSLSEKTSENMHREDEQPTHAPAEPKDLNSDQGKKENEALEEISSEEPESKVKNLTNPDKLENPKKESSAKERKVSAAAENSTSPPGYAPKTAVGTFPDESAILNAWNGLKAQKWRAMAAGTIVGSSILGIQFFLNHANGDPSGAVTLFKKTLEVAANDDYFKKMSLRPNQALDPNSSAFIGHFLGDALQAEKPAPVSPAPAPAHTTEPIQPTFFFGGL